MFSGICDTLLSRDLLPSFVPNHIVIPLLPVVPTLNTGSIFFLLILTPIHTHGRALLIYSFYVYFLGDCCVPAVLLGAGAITMSNMISWVKRQ